MQKKFGHEKTSIEIDNITGEYYTIIPEWVMHDQDWFDGTKIKWALEVDEVIIAQRVNDVGLSFEDNLNPSDYIKSLALRKVPKGNTLKTAKELKKYTIRK